MTSQFHFRFPQSGLSLKLANFQNFDPFLISHTVPIALGDNASLVSGVTLLAIGKFHAATRQETIYSGCIDRFLRRVPAP